MKTLVLIASLLLTGCWNSLSRFEIDRANKLCATRGATVAEVKVFDFGPTSVVCSDGSVSFLSNTVVSDN